MAEERTGSCVICARRDPADGDEPVCGACRSRLRIWLREVPDLFADMVIPEELGDRLDAAPVPGPGRGGRVSGSRERPLPIRPDPLDLAAEATVPSLTPRGVVEDQVGYLSVATVLDQWVRDWRDHRGKGEGLPEPTVEALCAWLHTRVDEACDDHPAIDEFAGELRGIRSALRGVLGLVEIPDYKKGVPCRRCDALTLVRLNGSDWVECAECPELLSPDEYDRWCKLLVAEAKTVGRAA